MKQLITLFFCGSATSLLLNSLLLAPAKMLTTESWPT